MDTSNLVLWLLVISLPLCVLVYKMPAIIQSLTQIQVLRNRRKLLSHQIQIKKMTEVEYLRVEGQNKDAEIQRLTNLLISRDPMTFQTIQSSENYSDSNPTDYTPSGTDIAEYNKWAQSQGLPLVEEPLAHEYITDGIIPG